MINVQQFAAETAIGLVKPFHRVECRCEQCIGWLQIEFCNRGAKLKQRQREVDALVDACAELGKQNEQLQAALKTAEAGGE